MSPNRPGLPMLALLAAAVAAAACSSAQRPPPPAAAAAVAPPPPGPNTPPPGFTALFDGRTLDGWRGAPPGPKARAKMSADDLAAAQARADEEVRQHWRVEDGVLLHDGRGKNLATAKEYGDFELLADWKIEAKGDSGLYLRGLPQVQLWDPDNPAERRNGAEAGSGALWNNKRAGNRPLVRADRPVGSWNSLRVRMVGALVWIWLNDKLVVDRVALENLWEPDRPAYARGPIELQTHGHPLWFRNLYLREIPYAEAVALLTAPDESAFRPIFDGKSLAGWQGPVENYEVLPGGALRCKAGKGGTIYTREQYADFVVRMEVSIPPGGNNGLAIRYPGSGDTAYVGMCELQVLDSEHPKYEKLDPRQLHGSAYGMAAAHRGYLRPAGEWNFQQVTVRGSRIEVELNGTTILDADLAPLADFLEGKAHPGKDRTSGHFGFAGHSDPVAYRNIRIRRLP